MRKEELPTGNKLTMKKSKDEIGVFNKLCKTIAHGKMLSLLLIALLIFLGWLFSDRWVGGDIGDRLWEWLDPVSGISALFITLVILYNQTYVAWKDSLEKRLTINYFVHDENGDKKIARVENAYLAGESDIRQWAQQLGRQMFGNLDLDMNWEEVEAAVVKNDGKEYYVNYEINLNLGKNPLQTDPGKEYFTEFKKNKSKLKYSEVVFSSDGSFVIWKRKG